MFIWKIYACNKAEVANDMPPVVVDEVDISLEADNEDAALIKARARMARDVFQVVSVEESLEDQPAGAVLDAVGQ